VVNISKLKHCGENGERVVVALPLDCEKVALQIAARLTPKLRFAVEKSSTPVRSKASVYEFLIFRTE